MNPQLSIPLLSFEGKPIRPFMYQDQPAFLASEVGLCLGLTDVSKSLRQSKMTEAGQDYAVVHPSTLGVTESESVTPFVSAVTILFESGLYALVLRSDKPAAIRFTRWIIREVLPEIRKTGNYSLEAAGLDRESLTPANVLKLMDLERRGSAYARSILLGLGLSPTEEVGKEVGHGN